MSKRQKKKIPKKSSNNIIGKNFTGAGSIGGIGVPGNIQEGSSSNTLPGNPFSTPQVTKGDWPAANLWYAQGKDSAKKLYFSYLNVLNQYVNCPEDQPDRRIQLAGEMNGLIVSLIQGITIALEAIEIAARRARTGDQAGKLEKAVIEDTLDRMLKMLWVHNKGADSGQFPSLEVKLIESSVTGRIKRASSDLNVTDVGVPILTEQEADALWADTPLQPPIDASATGMSVSPEQSSEGTLMGDENVIPDDQAPSPENEAANEFTPKPTDNIAPDDTLEIEEPEETSEQEVVEDPSIATFDQLQQPENEELDMSGPNQDLKIKWVAFIDENPELAAEMFDKAKMISTGEEEPEEDMYEEESSEEELPEEDNEIPEEGIEEEVPEEDYLDLADEEGEPEEIPEEEPSEEEIPEEEEQPTEEEVPEEEELTYCIECDRDVNQEDIDACDNPRCPFKQTEEEEEIPEEIPEEKGFDDIETKHLILVDHNDHSHCRTYDLNFPDFPGAECKFCLDHEVATAYSFEKKGWSQEDAKNWIQKQFKLDKEKNKSPEEIVSENIDNIDDITLKAWLGNAPPEEDEVDTESLVEMVGDILPKTLKSKFESVEKRLSTLEA